VVRSLTLLAGVALLCSSASAETLAGFFRAQGFNETRLQRRFGNHLFANATVNGRRAALMIDSSAATTVIHRDSAGTFGLAIAGPVQHATGVFGESTSVYAHTRLHDLQIGGRTFADVPVIVADEAARVSPPEFLTISKLKTNAKRKNFSHYVRIEPVDGAFGVELLRSCGAVVDCGHQSLFTRPVAAVAGRGSLSAFLADHGFARIPMRTMRRGGYDVPAAINGRPSRLVVDTGSSFTFINKQAGVAAGIFAAPERLAYDLGGNRFERIDRGTAKQLNIGSFDMSNVDLNQAEVSDTVLQGAAGLFGIDHLSMNYAVIDFGTGTLYLRHPDRR
jgi:predicted aspartyl protease